MVPSRFPHIYIRKITVGNTATLSASPDIIFLPQWDRDLAQNLVDEYAIFPYNHRWWWVPQYDAGLSSLADTQTLLTNWGNGCGTGRLGKTFKATQTDAHQRWPDMLHQRISFIASTENGSLE